MKFGMAFTVEERVVHVKIPEGIYVVNFDTQYVGFTRNNAMEEFMLPKVIMESPEFTKEDLKVKLSPYNITGKALCFECGTLRSISYSKDYQLVMEYLDTSKGEIGEHTHPVGVKEVYLTVAEPFTGEVCGEGEFHKTLWKKTLAVKFIDNKKATK